MSQKQSKRRYLLGCKKGFSYVEFLVVLAGMSIIAAGILSAYTFIARENTQRHLVVKQETDVSALIYYLSKDIGSAGFGIDKDNLWNRISVTTDNDKGDTFKFPSLASREEKWSGCWGIVNRQNKLITTARTFLNQPCAVCGNEECMKTNYWYIILDENRKNQCGSGKCNCGAGGDTCFADYKNTTAFYATSDGNYVYPDSFMVTYQLNQTDLPKECAPGTYNLVKTLGTSGKAGYLGNYPVISCVLKGSFRIRNRDGGYLNVSDQNFKKFPEIKMCLIIQAGGRQNTPSRKPQFKNCGSGFNIDDGWWNEGKWYPWIVIEENIVLRNLY
ncbi:MAG: hypothetical protein QXP38_08200 [Nitrososphaerota archaeon]